MSDRCLIVASVPGLKPPSSGFPVLGLTGVTPKDRRTTHTVWSLMELCPEEKQSLLSKYVEITSGIGVENGRESVWWYTWSSSRDRYHSRILADMEVLARFEKSCVSGLPDSFVLLCPDPYLAGAVTAIAQRNGISVQRRFTDRIRWMKRRLRSEIAPMVGGAKVCLRAMATKRRAGEFSVAVDRAKQAPRRTLFVTPIVANNLLEPWPTGNTFFGSLPQSMSSENHSVVIFGDLLDNLSRAPNKNGAAMALPVIPMASFTRIFDSLFAYLKGLFSPVSINKTLRLQDPLLRALVQRDIHNNRSSMVHGLIFQKALRRLFEILHPTHIIHACENNPWERACALVADNPPHQTPVTGYMHCAVLLSHTKIIITPEEKLVRPRPKRLICTGDRARDIMIKHGGHTADEVTSGYALRHEYLRDVQLRESLNQPIKNILVVLEGLPSMSDLLKFVFDALNQKKSYHTVIRPHPSYDLKSIFNDAGLAFADLDAITLSEKTAISDDLEVADLVVYKGSTAAIEAGYLGIPLIHVATPNILTDDPLFEITHLKCVVKAPEEMVPAIEKYSSMDHDVFLHESKALRQYAAEYLAIPRPDFTTLFDQSFELSRK